jgi:hypothetical protein
MQDLFTHLFIHRLKDDYKIIQIQYYLKGKGKELGYVVVLDTLSSSSVGLTGENHETSQSCVTTQG